MDKFTTGGPWSREYSAAFPCTQRVYHQQCGWCCNYASFAAKCPAAAHRREIRPGGRCRVIWTQNNETPNRRKISLPEKSSLGKLKNVILVGTFLIFNEQRSGDNGRRAVFATIPHHRPRTQGTLDSRYIITSLQYEERNYTTVYRTVYNECANVCMG